MVEPSFGWLARFRRLAGDFERLLHVLEALHFLIFATLMLAKAALSGSSEKHPFLSGKRQLVMESSQLGRAVLCRWMNSLPA